MSQDKLKGMKIAILATDGFEQSELFEPLKAVEEAGARVEIISLKDGKIKGWSDNDWGKSISVDKTASKAKAEDYDGLILPGGVINADILRGDKNAVNFVATYLRTNRPLAAICHAAWILIEAGGVEGRTMTSWASLKTDLENAGVKWVDQEVVSENGWVTSRSPKDLPAFNKKMIEEFAEGQHGSFHQTAASTEKQTDTPIIH